MPEEQIISEVIPDLALASQMGVLKKFTNPVKGLLANRPSRQIPVGGIWDFFKGEFGI